MSGAKFNPTAEKRGADEQAVNEANEKLPAEVGDDVVVDLREDGGHFIFQRRIPQRKIFPPAPLDRRTFLQEEKQIDRHHDQAEQETGHTEKPADALLEQRPDFLAQIGQLPLQVGQLLLDPFLDALAICRGERRWQRARSFLSRRGEAEGFAATTAAAAADDGEAVGEGFGDAAGVGDASSQFTKPEVGEELFVLFRARDSQTCDRSER